MPDDLPVRNARGCEQMKEGVIGGGNCPPQTRLAGTTPFAFSEMAGLFQQVVGERHLLLLFPKGLPQLLLLRFASKIEVCLESQLLRLDLLQNPCGNTLRNLSQPIRSACPIGNQDAKEQRLLASPVDRKTVHDAYNVRRKGAFRPFDACLDFRVIDQSGLHNRHTVIISRLGGGGKPELEAILAGPAEEGRSSRRLLDPVRNRITFVVERPARVVGNLKVHTLLREVKVCLEILLDLADCRHAREFHRGLGA